jgi:lysine 2,3-aminomutase
VRSAEQLAVRFPGLVPAEVTPALTRFPAAITPYYASLVEKPDMSDPIVAQAVPSVAEISDPPHLSDDPLDEDSAMPAPGLIHRYPDRALLLAATACAVCCRHCNRKRVTGQADSRGTGIRLAEAVGYLARHPEIRDVIISGGDPLTLSTDQLEETVSAVRSVPSVDIIRIGTRTPVVLPMRITNELVTMLRAYHPIFVNTHFNHPRELTPQSVAACARLADAGVPLGNQTVLLRGVNDNPQVLEELFRGLVRNRVRPYYLFQCDLVSGVEHFRTPLARGIEIMEYLRARLSGVAIPNFVVDTPSGGGKVPVLPDYVVSMSPTHTVLRSAKGKLVTYPEPANAP